ncbi:hypothetical protein K443DRAFT_633963 [Laccaria amethystina LaAM-08-1]|uniref:Rhodopsin domain-containing protein n=1 Tax=Laccaria amethystina LaAM-08-1 TaxID=1095629 RepID=A0A0C9WKV8_9AGAR|nr:hypothetical protein K443DRAFT_633963 [Laccaria amethystina LaAM-08-1]
MGLPAQSVLAWKITLTIFQAIAISSTLYRLLRRYRIQRLWWDDYVVVIPLVMDIVYTVTFCLEFRDSDPSLEKVLESYWLQLFFFLTIVWSTRIVLALSLGRIFPPTHRARKNSIVLAGIFLLAYVLAVVSPLFTCGGGEKSWSNPCMTSNGIILRGAFMSGADLTADTILVLFPLAVLWKIRLPRRERVLVLAVFSSSILTLLSALTLTIMAFSGIDLGPQTNLFMTGLGHVEAVTSLLVCNVAVVATSLYRNTRNRDNEESLDVVESTEKTSRPTEFDQVTPVSFTEVLEGTFENRSSSLRLDDRSEDKSRDFEGVRVL